MKPGYVLAVLKTNAFKSIDIGKWLRPATVLEPIGNASRPRSCTAKLSARGASDVS
jgi:hypothetical protein